MNCRDDPLLAERGFTEDQHNWMVEYPTAHPVHRGRRPRPSEATPKRTGWPSGHGQRDPYHRTTADVTWNGQTFPQGSYVVWMDQALRGIALTALSVGQDVSDRITQPTPRPAWSHGSLWGADVLEVPRGDAPFNPATVPITTVNALQGGVRNGEPADWYTVTLQGTAEVRAVLDLLRNGVDGEIAEESFANATGGQMPAGSLIFDADTAAAPAAAGEAAGVFERGVGAKPATTQLNEAPRVAILVNSSSPAEDDTSWSLRQIFGADVGFVSMVTGKARWSERRRILWRTTTRHLQHRPELPCRQVQHRAARLQAFFQRVAGTSAQACRLPTSRSSTAPSLRRSREP